MCPHLHYWNNDSTSIEKNQIINMNKSSISEKGKENTSSIWKIKHEYITYLWNIKHKYTKVNKAVSVTYTHLNIGFCTSAHMLRTKCTLTVCNKVYSSEAKCKMVVSMPGLTYTLIWPARLIGHWKPSTCFQVKPTSKCIWYVKNVNIYYTICTNVCTGMHSVKR